MQIRVSSKVQLHSVCLFFFYFQIQAIDMNMVTLLSSYIQTFLFLNHHTKSYPREHTGLIFILLPNSLLFTAPLLQRLSGTFLPLKHYTGNIVLFENVLMLLTLNRWDFVTPQTDTMSLRWVQKGTATSRTRTRLERVRMAQRTGLKMNFKRLNSSILVHLTQSYHELLHRVQLKFKTAPN